jgi:hypothetical protein
MKGEECLYIFMPFIVINGGIFMAYVWIVLHELYVQPLLDRRKQKITTAVRISARHW